MPGFQRVNPLGDAIIRGPARLLVAPITQAFPTQIESVIYTAATSTSYAADVQTVSITGTPTGGTFTLSYQSVQTSAIPYNTTSSAIQAILNAVPGIAAVGGVTCTGGPLPTTPIVVTFVNQGIQPLMLAQSTLLTGGTTPAATVAHTTSGVGQYDPLTGWTDLGSTKSGIQVMRNNTETQLDVDQILTSILAIPDEWEGTVTTQLAETTLENIAIAWECPNAIVVDSTVTPNERHLQMGAPLAYVNRRLAILHQKTIGTSAGRIRMISVRSVTKSPQNSTFDFQKTGAQQTIPLTFRMFADLNVTDPNQRFGEIVDQLAF
jgi:hypothetical protein